jgi:RNAse (barnase) inhibitor barstar
VRFVRGRKMTTKAGLMDELAAALQFPPYFGENWDALLDCLRDLNAPTVLAVADAGWLLNAAPPDELATFAEVLEQAAADHAQRGRPFQVVLGVRPSEAAAVEKRWKAAGAKPGRVAGT